MEVKERQNKALKKWKKRIGKTLDLTIKRFSFNIMVGDFIPDFSFLRIGCERKKQGHVNTNNCNTRQYVYCIRR